VPTLLEIAGLVLLGGGALVRPLSARALAAWKEATLLLGASPENRVDPGATLLTTIDELSVQLELDSSLARGWHARFWAHVNREPAELPLTGEVWIRARARGLRGLLDGIVEGEELATGDDDFDRAYAVRTNRPPLARALLDDPRRRALVGLRGVDLGIGPAGIDVRVVGDVTSAAVVVAAAQAAAAFARSLDAFEARWRAAADELGAAPVGPLGCEVLSDGRILRVEPDAALERTLVTLEGERGQRTTESLPGVEPDARAWRETLGRLRARTGGRGSLPYR